MNILVNSKTSILDVIWPLILKQHRIIQNWAIRLALGCVNLRPAARGSQEVGFTQPRAHLSAHLCIYNGRNLIAATDQSQCNLEAIVE